ncbi:MAG: gluconokinase, GntK/IdnK-type [Pseudodesulfovibrio sp.]
MKINCKAIVLVGPMGCGKTTVGRLLADRLGWEYEDADNHHSQSNINKMHSGKPLQDSDRRPWLEKLQELIQQRVSSDRRLVLGCSALKQEYRQAIGIDQNAIVSVYLHGKRELLQERLENRTHKYMPNDLLDSQLTTLEKPRTGLTVDISLGLEEIVNSICQQLQ